MVNGLTLLFRSDAFEVLWWVQRDMNVELIGSDGSVLPSQFIPLCRICASWESHLRRHRVSIAEANNSKI